MFSFSLCQIVANAPQAIENTIDPNQECPPRFRRCEERHCHDDAERVKLLETFRLNYLRCPQRPLLGSLPRTSPSARWTAVARVGEPNSPIAIHGSAAVAHREIPVNTVRMEAVDDRLGRRIQAEQLKMPGD